MRLVLVRDQEVGDSNPLAHLVEVRRGLPAHTSRRNTPPSEYTLATHPLPQRSLVWRHQL